MSYRFSIIIPHYDGAVKDEDLLRCLKSLAAQTFRDFEVLLFHDGPPSRALPAPPDELPNYRPRSTDTRANDYGHSLRDLGIRLAQGDYIVHLNADNLLYPDALEEIDRTSRREEEETVSLSLRTNPALLVFPIAMRGVVGTCLGHYIRTFNPEHTVILTGCPPVVANIDCMQLVMRRELWLAYGGWYDKSRDSDGNMYPRFIREQCARMVGKVLGEHW
jgi:glycosyltransferase involved in cell wall biosynthesis